MYLLPTYFVPVLWICGTGLASFVSRLSRLGRYCRHLDSKTNPTRCIGENTQKKHTTPTIALRLDLNRPDDFAHMLRSARHRVLTPVGSDSESTHSNGSQARLLPSHPSPTLWCPVVSREEPRELEGGLIGIVSSRLFTLPIYIVWMGERAHLPPT
ncbi:hypothetical protein F5B22DRAFT_198831 [Xylaria bambusicola]|uniref:uncharacterized protein n=1 Tax=Xylaria bambusicola TaxID=326684 RepID=UPI0020074C46|nr:uncharacterized protein F5B22DRAFT_198831 [Xylaria bambusicola]KAI0515330.1 hypothetical protein F5B22DRAFT_198831 [Xylaria bambusicola]